MADIVADAAVGDGRGFQGRRAGRSRGGRGGRGTTPQKTTYYSTTEWEMLSYEERDRVRKERDKKGEQGGSKRTISEMTTKQNLLPPSSVLSRQQHLATPEHAMTTSRIRRRSQTPVILLVGVKAQNEAKAIDLRERHIVLLQLSISALTQPTHRTAKCELDFHADTCALGCNFAPLYFTGCACDVIPYNAGAYEPERDIPIVCGATAFTCQQSGETFILIINEGLYFGDKLEHSLLKPNQLRFSGVVVNDNPFDKAALLLISTTEIDIPLQNSGTNIFLETTTPTQRELGTCTHIHLTCDTEWNPQTVNLSHVQSVEAEDTIGVEPFLSQIDVQHSSHFCLEIQQLHECLSDAVHEQ